MEGWISSFAEQIARFYPDKDARAFAMKILVSLEGAWILARMLRSRDELRRIGMGVLVRLVRVDADGRPDVRLAFRGR
ncbi:hypothetical protein NY536_25220, partial [Enterobacter hormaechei]|nr:hypothetical protein [Enterobacter hormaechei]